MATETSPQAATVDPLEGQKAYDMTSGQPPPEGHDKVGQWVWDNFIIAKDAKVKGNWHKKWLRNHELGRGKHFKHRDPTKSKYPLVPVNLFHVVLATTRANLTDNKPKFDITPHSDMAKNKAPIMHRAATQWWKRTNQQGLLSLTVGNSEKYGTTVEKMLFDPSLEAGLGEIDTAIIDPFRFYPWPNIQDIQRMPRMFEIDVMQVEDILRQWPETSEKVTAEHTWADITGKDREDVRAGSVSQTRHSDNLPTNYSTGSGKDIRVEGIKQALVIECWCKDYTMEPVFEDMPVLMKDEFENEVLDEDRQPIPMIDDNLQPVTEQVQVGEKPKYPGFIRMIHITNDGKVVLDDMPNPSINPQMPDEAARQTYLYDKYPYLKSDSNTDETNFWGYSIFEQLEILVLEINKKVSQIAAFIDRTVRPTLIIPKIAGIEKHEVTNLPGQAWFPQNHIAAQFIRYLSIPNLPSDFYKYLELLLKLVDIISGIHDVTQGRKPAGVTAATAIMALQESAQTIFRDKIRNLDTLIEERGRMWVSLAQNWYTESRMVTMSGKDMMGPEGEFASFRGQDLPPSGEFTFAVVTGSTMPKSIYAQREQAIQLYQAGAVDQREILEIFDWPNREEVIQRMSQGPLGQLLERLEQAGAPPEVMAAVEHVGSMDENEFKQAYQQSPAPLGGTKIAAAQAGSA